MNSKDRMLTLGGKAGFVALLLTAGVACGQESDGLSSSELASEMNQICADNGEEFEAVGHPETFEQIAAMTPALIEIFDGTLARMDQLDAADADSEAFDEFVTLGRKQSELLGRLQIAAASEAGDDFEAVVGEMAVVAERSDELATSLGAAECVG